MMYTNKIWTKGILAAGLLVMLSSYGLKADQASSTLSDSSGATFQAPSGTVTEETALKRASRVMHVRVKGTDGKTLGRVHDIVLTPDLTGISYVAVSSDGMLGFGSTLHAVPWSALTPGLDHTYSLPVTKTQFLRTPGFRMAYWPESAETNWTISSTGAGRKAAYGKESKAERRAIEERRFSRIKGTPVRDTNNKHAGRIHDMVIVQDNGQIAYTVVSYDGLLGLGSRYAAVPEAAIRLEPERHVARLDTTEAVVKANSFTSNRWPALTSPGYAQQLDRAYGVPISGTALGYVAPETPAAAPAAPRPTPSPAPAPPATSTTQPVTPLMAAMAEPTAAELTGTFNPATVTTVEGTVIEEGKYKATPTGPDMLWLRIRANDGRTVIANLGPRNYVSAQDFYIVRGDNIRLTGSDVTAAASGKHVFLPTDVTYDSHVLRLRSATGTPLWEGPAAGAMTSPGTTGTPPTQPDMDTGTLSVPSTTREPNEPNKP